MAIQLSVSLVVPARSRREGSLRAPWRRGTWSAGEVALALHARRAELLRGVRLRADAGGVPAGVLEELVNEAMCVVVMMRRPVVSEEHLMGAFWTAVRLLLRHQREGRRDLRVGKRGRVELETLAAEAMADDPGPDEIAELRDRVARAADFVAELSEFEREVVATMALRGVGANLAARTLGVPVRAVRAAERSARAKLDRVAVIAAAGRMCHYRARVIVTYATGETGGEAETLARAHLAACPACRASYVRMVREMRGRDFQQATAAAFLPVPALAFGHHLGALGRLVGCAVDRVAPAGGPGERAAEALGGAGLVKAAAAGGAVIVATATLATGIPRLVMPTGHHSQRVQHRRVPSPLHHTPAVAAPAPAVSGSAAVSATPAAPKAARLTPQAHAEREFGLESSPSSSGGTSPRHASASAASVHATSTASVTGLERSESPARGSESSADAQGASQAAHEFGQP
jgi:hypothetical protein